MQDFINPKSMMTPGIAGATLMFMVNGIVFAFPELSPRILALALSFLIGSIVFASQKIPSSAIGIKAAFWIVNSLIIFVVGFGTANFSANNVEQMDKVAETGTRFPALIASAYAQQSGKDVKTNTKAELMEQLELERKKNAEMAERLKLINSEKKNQKMEFKESDSEKEKPVQKKEPRFFINW